MSNSASVTIQLSEFQAIQQACAEAKLEAAKLRDQLREVKIGTSDQATLDVARAALEIVRYAVSSMPAESNIGWPSKSLKVIAAKLQLLPDAQQDDLELGTTIGYFAKEVDLYEARRQGIAQAQVLAKDRCPVCERPLEFGKCPGPACTRCRELREELPAQSLNLSSRDSFGETD